MSADKTAPSTGDLSQGSLGPALPKRKVENDSTLEVPKKRRCDLITFTKESLDEFKKEIIDEVTNSFESRFKELESRIDSFKSSGERSDSEQDNNEEEEEEEEDATQTLEPTLEPVQKVAIQKLEPRQSPKATFGASSFHVSIATPQNSFAESPTVPNSSRSSPMPPVFGTTTAFGNSAVMDSLKNRKSVFDTLPSHSDSGASVIASAVVSDVSTSSSSSAGSTTGAIATTSFGANTKFANAFQKSISKKSFLDDDSEAKNGADEPRDVVGSSETTTTEFTPQFKQVDLEKQSVHTGEEDELFTFTTTCKLFALDLTKVSEGWKERGLGPVHVNQSKVDAEQARIVMRSQGLLRVVLNYKINQNTELLKGLEASLNPGKYVRLNSVNSEGHPIQYLLKFGSETTRNDFCNAVEGIKKLQGAA